MKRKHLLPAEQSRRGTATGTGALYPTGGAEVRLERLSGDAAAATWYDISGNGNNGTANNSGACLANYYFRGGALGSGTDDFVTTAFDGNIILATQPWSLEMWCTRDGVGPTGQVTLSGCRNHSPNGGWILRENAAGVSGPIDLDCPYYTNAPDIIPDIVAGAWAHIVVTRTAGVGVGAGHLTAYLNGTQTYSASHNYFAPGDIFEIAGSTYNRWPGFIDTVRAFSRVLNPDEILRDYNAGKPEHP